VALENSIKMSLGGFFIFATGTGIEAINEYDI